MVGRQTLVSSPKSFVEVVSWIGTVPELTTHIQAIEEKQTNRDLVDGANTSGSANSLPMYGQVKYLPLCTA